MSSIRLMQRKHLRRRERSRSTRGDLRTARSSKKWRYRTDAHCPWIRSDLDLPGLPDLSLYSQRIHFRRTVRCRVVSRWRAEYDGRGGSAFGRERVEFRSLPGVISCRSCARFGRSGGLILVIGNRMKGSRLEEGWSREQEMGSDRRSNSSHRGRRMVEVVGLLVRKEGEMWS